ncbi:MAG: AAA family ATPase [Spirochaetales bacterium]|nr:AAA family ATPase [Spirochaetales bacterium]
MTVIDTNELYRILEITPAYQNIMLAGKHGIGKSQILTKYFEEKGFKVVPLFLGQMSDSGDILGLPDRDTSTGRTEFLPPFWFPKDNTPVVLFLDELNRARPEILQCIQDLALNKTIAGRPLPEGSRIISAVNLGDEYQLTDLDPALVSRFNIYEFRPSVTSWLLWAQKNGIDQRIIGFITENADALDGDDYVGELDNLEKSPDRRGWEKVSDIIKNVPELDMIYLKAISGIIGARAMAKFNQYIAANHMVTGRDIYTDFEAVQQTLEKYTTPQLAIVNDSIYQFLEAGEEIPGAASNLLHYAQWLNETSRNEALSHFANNFLDPHYPKAQGFIMAKLPSLYSMFIEFIEDISFTPSSDDPEIVFGKPMEDKWTRKNLS